MKDKIVIWKRKLKEENVQMFSKTDECNFKYDISSLIFDHLTLLEETVHNYFPNIEIKENDWIRNPFVSAATNDFSRIEEVELVEIKNNQSLLMIKRLNYIVSGFTFQRSIPIYLKRR